MRLRFRSHNGAELWSRDFSGLQRGVRVTHIRQSGPNGPIAQQAKINLRAFRMQVPRALGKFGELADAAAQREALDGVFCEIFQKPTREIAHIQHGVIGQRMELLDHAFTRRPGASGDMPRAGGNCHINAPVD